MKVLFLIEPVIFRNEPAHLVAHLPWAHALARAVVAKGGTLSLAANREIGAEWLTQQAATNGRLGLFELDAFQPLSAFDYRRDRYMAALFGDGGGDNQLKTTLAEVRRQFAPDIVVMTSQNAFARRAFVGVPILCIEQAPLPRLGQPHRISFDPLGHQVGSLLEVHSPRIRELALREADIRQMCALIDRLKAGLKNDPRYCAIAEEVEKLHELGRIALLVTQPPDWSTYEGAFYNVSLEGLLCAWEENLPPGWIGVPTYHPGFRLSREVEESLCRYRPRLHFLPPDLAQGATEILLLLADGMVSISSTSTITALLFGKSAVAVGKCPFSAWAGSEVGEIASVEPLKPDEAARLLAFLTNRYSYLKDEISEVPELLESIFEAVRGPNPVAWYFDFSEWSPARSQALMNLPPPS